jgi:hypothetical protein
MGLCSFGCCSGMSSLLRCKICIYICSNGSNCPPEDEHSDARNMLRITV